MEVQGADVLAQNAPRLVAALPAYSMKLQATGKPEATADDVEGMVGMAHASGYARLEGEHLTSALKIEGGQMTLNGKPMALPMAALQ
ncbi:MAG: DUF945 family protein [Comamonadaceae bacterium]|nr:DUF945 family protein [Comamonadaceae bacterium]MBN9369091.1 DUF945 family protein [Comamonadaceae bacterium]